jgi:hypothetical protein
VSAQAGRIVCDRIGNRHEAVGNSKTTEPSWFSMCIHPLCWADSEKISRNREHVRDRARRRWTTLWKRRRVGSGGFGKEQERKIAALGLLGAG